MNGKNSSAPGFLLSPYCRISLQPPPPYVNQPKITVIPDSHHMVITLHVQSMAIRMETIRGYAGGGSSHWRDMQRASVSRMLPTTWLTGLSGHKIQP
jgi:hypothetical protein